MKPHRFHREADAEFIHAVQYYSDLSPKLGNRFFDAVEAAIVDVRTHPLRFRLVEPPVRRCRVPGFPYALLYIDEPARVWIVAVMPLKRDPDYWKHRLAN